MFQGAERKKTRMMVVENTCLNNVTICVCLHELLIISSSSRVYCCSFAYGNQHGGGRRNNVNHCQVCFFAGRGSTCCCLSDPYSSKNPNYCTAIEEANAQSSATIIQKSSKTINFMLTVMLFHGAIRMKLEFMLSKASS